MQPCDADPISFFQVGDARPKRSHNARAFMPGDKWRVGFDRPIALHCVQVGMTHTGRDDLDQSLSRSRRRNRHFADL